MPETLPGVPHAPPRRHLAAQGRTPDADTERIEEAHTIPRMTMRLLRYSIGNENNPGDPWGRSELVIQPDGTTRLDHHFSRLPKVGAWSGQVDPAALDALWGALERAGFPAAPTAPPVPGATLRRLTVETDGVSEWTFIDWRTTSSLPGYAEAFDILDAVIRQLSGDCVPYPTTQPAIVSDIAAI